MRRKKISVYPCVFSVPSVYQKLCKFREKSYFQNR